MSSFYIRDPIHGFIEFDDWEKEIIDHWVFQRLRRIRQLGWTDMVYPGGAHTRFEHSVGVMHLATLMFENIVQRRKDFLRSELNYTDVGLERERVLVRIASLLHDTGHPPFSHAGEGLMPENSDTGESYTHEDYSAAVVSLLQDVIEDHPKNKNHKISAREVTDFLNGKPSAGGSLLWRQLLVSQLDADRADYLLRDSHHIGVAYGRYDLARLLSTLTITIDPDTEAPVLAVESGGWHAAEAFILARYMMFTQVYFHKTRRAYDRHITETMRNLLEAEQTSQGVHSGCFPPPTERANLRDYLNWTDWKVLGLLQQGAGGEHGRIIRERKHYRRVYETPEVAEEPELEFAEYVCQSLGTLVGFVDNPEQSWYKFEREDIPVVRIPKVGAAASTYLSRLSTVVNGLKSVNQVRIHVSEENRKEAEEKVESLRKERKEV